jgi:hypothetical protein
MRAAVAAKLAYLDVLGELGLAIGAGSPLPPWTARMVETCVGYKASLIAAGEDTETAIDEEYIAGIHLTLTTSALDYQDG